MMNFCARYMRELTYDPLFPPMLALEQRDLETGLPDDTYAQFSLALQQVLGGTGRSVQRHIGFDGSACFKLGLGLLHRSAGGRAISTISKHADLRFV